MPGCLCKVHHSCSSLPLLMASAMAPQKPCQSPTRFSCTLHHAPLQRANTLATSAALPPSPPPKHCDNPATWSSQAIVSTAIQADFQVPLQLPCDSSSLKCTRNPCPSPSGLFPSQGWPSAQARFPSKPQGGPCYVRLYWPRRETLMILWL